jgi:2,3-diaminopropionate biosynthesis protein SbnB
MLVLGHADVRTVLDGREVEIIDAVGQAYALHERGHTAVPHSVFLRFPGNHRDRIIGLPAYLGADVPVTGMKWVASFPANVPAGMPRASAVVVLNSAETGRPEALLEGSIISARRTGAGAALAARLLTGGRAGGGAALVGCGVINFEVLRFLLVTLPGLAEITLYDTEPTRTEAFGERCARAWPGLGIAVASSPAEAMAAHPLVSLATTAVSPHLDTDACPPGAVILHVSLRDLTPAAILRSRNIVDDPDHVCRERTSLHLAEEETGDRGFIHGRIGRLVGSGRGAVRERDERVTVFSPFGLGILDLAVARLARTAAEDAGLGVRVPDFLP